MGGVLVFAIGAVIAGGAIGWWAWAYEIASVLSEHGNGWMTTEELAAEVNARGRYKRTRPGDVTAYQVHGRTRNYGALFVRKGARVRLADAKRGGNARPEA